MNCEQVEELLSAYLDDALAPEDRREVAAHIQTCTNCSALLAEFSRNDALLSHLPRVSPDPALRERIFSSPEFLELTGTFDAGTEVQKEWTAPRLPAKSPRQNPAGRPQLVAIPGGRSTLPTAAVNPRARRSTRQRRSSRRLAVLFVSIAAVLIVAFAITSLLKVISGRIKHRLQPPMGQSLLPRARSKVDRCRPVCALSTRARERY